MARVLVGQRHQPGPRAALRDRERVVRKELAQLLEIRRRERQQRFPGAVREGQVVPHQECAQDRLVHFLGQIVEKALLASHDPSLPHSQHHAHCIVAVPGEADDVGVPPAHLFHDLRPLQLVQPLERVPDVRGALEFQPAGGLVHALAQPSADLDRLALQKRHHVIDHAPVVFLRLIRHARGQAAMDVVVQAGPVRRVLRKVVVA